MKLNNNIIPAMEKLKKKYASMVIKWVDHNIGICPITLQLLYPRITLKLQ